MGKIRETMKEHGSEIAGWVTTIAAIFGFVIYLGILHQKVASAEENIKVMQSDLSGAQKTGEDRVIRIYDKLEGFSKKLDDFTKEQRDHLTQDAIQSKEIAIKLEFVANELKAIRTDLNRRSSK